MLWRIMYGIRGTKEQNHIEFDLPAIMVEDAKAAFAKEHSGREWIFGLPAIHTPIQSDLDQVIKSGEVRILEICDAAKRQRGGLTSDQIMELGAINRDSAEAHRLSVELMKAEMYLNLKNLFDGWITQLKDLDRRN